jgi:hypothetical protein
MCRADGVRGAPLGTATATMPDASEPFRPGALAAAATPRRPPPRLAFPRARVPARRAP